VLNQSEIDVLKLDDPLHQELLGKLIKKYLPLPEMKLKKGEGFEIEGQKIELKQTIFSLKDLTGKLIFNAFANENGKRVQKGKGAYGKVSVAYPLTLEINKKSGKIFARLKKTPKGKIEQRAIKSVQDAPEVVKTEVDHLKLLPSLDVRAQGIFKKKKVEESFQNKDKFYIDMLLFDGESLKFLREKKGAFSLLERFELTLKILENLEEIHKKGVIHRDIKPENIVVNINKFNATLIDFGLSDKIGDTTYAGGTSPWMSPEFFTGSGQYIANPAMDVYSICLVLAELWGEPNLWDNESFIEVERTKGREKGHLYSFDNLTEYSALKDILKLGLNSQSNIRPAVIDLLKACKEAYISFLKNKGVQLLDNAIREKKVSEAKLLYKRNIRLSVDQLKEIKDFQQASSLQLDGKMKIFFEKMTCAPVSIIEASFSPAANTVSVASKSLLKFPSPTNKEIVESIGVGVTATAIGVVGGTALAATLVGSGVGIAVGGFSLASIATGVSGVGVPLMLCAVPFLLAHPIGWLVLTGIVVGAALTYYFANKKSAQTATPMRHFLQANQSTSRDLEPLSPT